MELVWLLTMVSSLDEGHVGLIAVRGGAPRHPIESLRAPKRRGRPLDDARGVSTGEDGPGRLVAGWIWPGGAPRVDEEEIIARGEAQWGWPRLDVGVAPGGVAPAEFRKGRRWRRRRRLGGAREG